MATRQKKPKMAEQKQSSVGGEDIFSGMEPQVTYSFAECQQIGKEFLEGLKQSVKGSTLLEIEEPCAKATNYLVKTEVLHLLEDLIAKLVFLRPEKPIDFLISEIEGLKKEETSKNEEEKVS